MPKSNLIKSKTGLLIVDIQEKIFNTIAHPPEFLSAVLKLIQGFQIFQIPILISEQYPQGLGETLWPIKNLLQEGYQPWKKSSFFCLDDNAFSCHLLSLNIEQWVLIGLEAHVCVLQTAKSLIRLGKEVVVLNDAIASRSLLDFSISLLEMRESGIRVSSTETILFELLKDAANPEFKAISQLIKERV